MTFDTGEKLQFIHFEDSPHETPKPNFDRHHENIAPLDSVKLLGIHLDKKLNFRKHVEEKLKSFRSVIYLMSELMNGLNTANAKLIYTVACRTVLEYGSEIWCHYLRKEDWDRIEKIQKTVLRRILGVPMHTPTAFCQKELGIMPIRRRLNLKLIWLAARIKYRLKETNPILKCKEDLNSHPKQKKFQSPLLNIIKKKKKLLLQMNQDNNLMEWTCQFLKQENPTSHKDAHKAAAQLIKLDALRKQMLLKAEMKTHRSLQALDYNGTSSTKQLQQQKWASYEFGTRLINFTTSTPLLQLGKIFKTEDKSVTKQLVRFRIGFGKVSDYYEIMGKPPPQCECGEAQNMTHIFETCPISKELFETDEKEFWLFENKGLNKLLAILKEHKNIKI
ncbi:unnamed protein product [Ambrosiozyma monospora]|uniref:Unnamed protein product n=1 Tax=Ambrosiozyma monospora TaxID=43982 RepID=A0A9W7DF73_AMBMO|nr:unnamed protein product [Ambrosiozyma monospora]